MAEEVKEVKAEKKVAAPRKTATKKAVEKTETPVAVKAPAKKVKTAKKGVANQYIATGRRKDAVARVRLVANGTGKITINKRDIDDYFMLETLKLVVRQPLVLTQSENKFDIFANVVGGGISGQAGAIRHGISRAMVIYDEKTYKADLKQAGFLTRDPRMKERNKYGLKKARKAPQFSKR